MIPTEIAAGFSLYDRLLGEDAQGALAADLRAVAEAAPMFSPVTRWGKPMSVKMTSAGRVGWYSDRRGYRYEPRHPSGAQWPAIPESVLNVWREVSGYPKDPDCCLINYYSEKAKMGLHRDADEEAYDAPVVSISLGDSARFRIGGLERSDPTQAIDLHSGDVLVMGGPARLAYHGVDRIRFGTSTLLPKGGRINVTLRVVHPDIGRDSE
ncbi:MAG: alpha-ketoglutarate-dependent dioxygenase AlkB [Pseudomonadota bacterium]